MVPNNATHINNIFLSVFRFLHPLKTRENLLFFGVLRRCEMGRLAWKRFNLFVPNALFLYPLKTSESLWFSDVFRGQKKGALGTNGLRYRPYSSCFMQAIIARTRLPFFKIFSNFVHFDPNFQIFCPLFPFFCPFSEKSHACPSFLK